MPPRQPLLVRLQRLAHGALGWGWAISFATTMLCALPWIEFANPDHSWPTIGTAALLTLSGVGQGYFAARATSGRRRQILRQIGPQSRALVRMLAKLTGGLAGLTFLASFVVGWYALVPGMELVSWLHPRQRGDFRSGLVLFQRNNASIQTRPNTGGGYKALVVRPLSPWLNLRTDLAANQPDTTWAVCYPAALVPSYTQREIGEWQLRLLRQVASKKRLAAFKAAQQFYQRKSDAARGFNTLCFELDTEPNSLDGPRSVRRVRSLAIDGDESPSFYAGFNAKFGLWMHVLVANGSATESFNLTVPQFNGSGRYELTSPAPDPDKSSPGYAEFSRYYSGINTAYVSKPTAPLELIITRYDTLQQVIVGRFAGVLLTRDGKSAVIRNGLFEVRYR